MAPRESAEPLPHCIKDRLFQLGFEPVSVEGEQFQRDISAEIKRWSEIIEKAGLKAQ